MSDNGRKRGLTDEQWPEVRAKYESGASVASLAREYGVPRSTINRRRSKEGWIVEPSETPPNGAGGSSGKSTAQLVHERVQSNVIDLASRRAVEQLVAAGVVDDAAQVAAEEVQDYRDLVAVRRDAIEYMRGLLAKAKNGEIVPASGPGEQSEADVAKAVMSATRTLYMTLRDDLGRVRGQPTIPSDKPDGKPTTLEFVIVDGPQQSEAS